MDQINGKVALITGGASGIGRATAELLAARGATVMVADIDPSGESVADGIGGRFVTLDVSDPVAWTAAAAATIDGFGTIDILHLNAGTHAVPRGASLGTDPVNLLTATAFERVIGINLGGLVHGIAAVLPHMESAGRGDIIVTSSLAGLKPLREDPLYAMTKHGAIGLVRSLAPTLAARGVRIQAICPGAVDTALPPPELRPPPESLAPPSFQAEVVRHALEVGAPGDIWVAIRAGEPPWRHVFPSIRPPAADPGGG